MLNRDLETDHNTKTEYLVIRVTPQEKITFAQEAQKAGISISAFIRLLLRNWADGITFTKKHNGGD